jgi:peptidoglycan biosynthesis protein MviN/MurJ (putative lipid II flippase)
MVDKMDIQKEDIVSVIITLCLLLTWYLTLISFNYPLISISILWVGMIVLSIVYYVVYRKKKRDMRILKTRFFVSVVPIYSALVFYVYLLLYEKEISGGFRLLPIGIIGTMLFLNASVVYFYSRRV